jgi:hypothetical protein
MENELVPTPIVVNRNGKDCHGLVVYLDDERNVVTADKATQARVVFDDGSRASYLAEKSRTRFVTASE